jgi:formylglycine-generating enzyme required for sulfatase activity
MKQKAVIFLLIPLFFVGCTFSDAPITMKILIVKVENRIAYIRHNIDYEPSRLLNKLKIAMQESLNTELDESDKNYLVNTTSPVNKMSLVYIPASDFLMGSSSYDGDHYENEEPLHSVYLDSYWITKTEITNAQFSKCVQEGTCTYSVSMKRNPRFLDSDYTDHPVVYINWYMAQTFCQWSGGRLPTEAEWEKAARGPSGAKYPWGSENPSEDIFLTNAHNIITDTTPVGLFIKGASYYGVMDMGGNVREWVSDWYDPFYFSYSPYENPQGPEDGDKKVLKGASYLDPYEYSRAASRLAHEPSSSGAVRSFRCVYTHAATQIVQFTSNN